MIIVLDTNIVASATYWRGKPAHCLEAWVLRKYAPSIADPGDEKFIECAVAASADYLVTGDRAHLLSVKEAAEVPIVSVADFLRLLGAPENPT